MHRTPSPLLLAGALALAPLAHAQDAGWPAPPYKRATMDSPSCPRPEYPPASMAAGEEGKVLLMFLVDGRGKILQERVARSSGHPRLDQAAQDALRRCRFIPFNGPEGPVESVAQVEYVWRIQAPVKYIAVPVSTAQGCQPPAAPADAAADAPKSVAQLALVLTVDGWVEQARVDKASGNARFDALALAAYAACRFRAPAGADGVNVKGLVTIEHAWR